MPRAAERRTTLYAPGRRGGGLTPADVRMAGGLLAEPFSRPAPARTPACAAFYAGCGCPGCLEAEGQHPGTWPRAGAAKRKRKGSR